MATSNDKIAHIPAVPDPPPDSAVAVEFDAIRHIYNGDILNWHRVVGNDVELLAFQNQMFLHLSRPTETMTPTEGMIMGLVISRVRRCEYCEGIISYFLRRGLPEGIALSAQEVAAILEDYQTAGLDNRMLEICRVARRIAQNPASVSDNDCARLHKAGVSDNGILEIVTRVAYYQFVTVMMHALGMVSDMTEERIEALLNRKSDA